MALRLFFSYFICLREKRNQFPSLFSLVVFVSSATRREREMIACLTIVFVECNSCFSLFFSAEAPSPLLSVHFSTLGEESCKTNKKTKKKKKEKNSSRKKGDTRRYFYFLYPNDIFRFFQKEKKERGPPTGQLKEKKKKKMLLTPKLRARAASLLPPSLPALSG